MIKGKLRKILIFVLGVISIVALACGLSACGDDDSQSDGYGFLCKYDTFIISDSIDTSVKVDTGYAIYDVVWNNKKLTKTLIIPSTVNVNGDERAILGVSLNLQGYLNEPTDVVISEGIKFVSNIIGNVNSVTFPSTFMGSGENDDSVLFINDNNRGVRTQINISQDNPYYYVEGNCLINRATKMVVLGCGNSVIPSDGSVTGIAENAFRGCRDIQRITYGEENQPTKSINPDDSLVTLNIPKTITYLGIRAFWDCTGLIDVTLPPIMSAEKTENGLTKFSYYFYLSYWSDDILNYKYYYNITTLRILCDELSDDVFGETYGQKETPYRNVTTVIIDSKITELPNGLFKNFTALQTVVLPDSVTKIGDEAFYGCTSLKSITIGKNVTYIGNDAFKNSGLESAKFEGVYSWYENSNAYRINYADLQIGYKAAEILLSGSIVQR
jgi:hypothetical protein